LLKRADYVVHHLNSVRDCNFVVFASLLNQVS